MPVNSAAKVRLELTAHGLQLVATVLLYDEDSRERPQGSLSRRDSDVYSSDVTVARQAERGWSRKPLSSR